MEDKKELVVITVLGKNRPGILAGITKAIADSNVGIEDVCQRIMQGYFTLMMMTDLSGADCTYEEFQDKMLKASEELQVKTFIQHEDVFKFQHRI